MTDEDALLAAVAAAPADALPRLVYADWLDDRGDAVRAELVRLVAVPGQAAETFASVIYLYLLTDCHQQWLYAVAHRDYAPLRQLRLDALYVDDGAEVWNKLRSVSENTRRAIDLARRAAES